MWSAMTENRADPAQDIRALVQAAADGEAAAWKALVGRFDGLVWSVARGYRLSDADAEDVCQTVWFRLAENLGRIKEPDRVGAWLATTARREALRLIRARARTTPTGDPDLLDAGSAIDSPEQILIESEEAAADAEQIRQLWQAFGRLSARCRELLRVLVASPPPSYAEVAAGLGMKIGSIGPTRARCLAELRELLARQGITSGPAYK
jgi:RNA polymerase sigma factor (sigma-70 family)